jgi:hypothetical protein
MDTERKAATEAENKPVCHVIVLRLVTVRGYSNMNVNTRTHENENAIRARLPPIGHPVVFFLRNL